MDNSFADKAEEWEAIYARHADTVYRVCFLYMKNKYDAEDMVQNTFIRLMNKPVEFQSENHEKAWLITTATNLCKDFFRHWWQKTVGIDVVAEQGKEDTFQDDELLEKVFKLPDQIRVSIYLHYYEGYKTSEIAEIIGKKEATVRSNLHRGRQLLKIELEGSKDE